MDLPADSDADIRDSQQRLDGARGEARLPAMLVGIAGGRLKMPPACAGPYEISAAHARPLTGETATDAAGMPEIAVPPVPGYYTLTTRIGAALLAVEMCIRDRAGHRPDWLSIPLCALSGLAHTLLQNAALDAEDPTP